LIALEAGLFCFGGFCVLADSLAFQGEFRREKCNMLQKSLVKKFIRLSNRPVKLVLEAKKNFFDKIM